MKAVLDTNVSFGALMDPTSAPGRALQAWRESRFSLVLSPALLSELRSVLRWRASAAAFIEELEAGATLVDPPRTLDLPGISPGDNRVLEAAAAAGAAYVVTNDRALLALREFRGVAIVTPARFLAALNAAASSKAPRAASHGTGGSEGSGVGP